MFVGAAVIDQTEHVAMYMAIVLCPHTECMLCSYYYVKSYAEGSGVIHLAAGIV